MVEGHLILQQLGSNSLEKFKKLMLNHEVAINPNKKFCPIAGCENVIEAKKGTKKIQCNKCRKDVCLSCNSEWHLDKTCEKYQKE
jgi:hypothetical protein